MFVDSSSGRFLYRWVEQLRLPRELQLVHEVGDVEALTPGQVLKEDAPAVKVEPFRFPKLTGNG